MQSHVNVIGCACFIGEERMEHVYNKKGAVERSPEEAGLCEDEGNSPLHLPHHPPYLWKYINILVYAGHKVSVITIP